MRAATKKKSFGYRHEGVRTVSATMLILAGAAAFVGNLGQMIITTGDHPRVKMLSTSLDHLKYTVDHNPLNVGGWFLMTAVGLAFAALLFYGIVRAARWRLARHDRSFVATMILIFGGLLTLAFGIITYAVSVSDDVTEGPIRSSWVAENFQTNRKIPSPTYVYEDQPDGRDEKVYYPATFSGIPVGGSSRLYYKVAPIFNASGDKVGIDMTRVSKEKAKKIQATYLKKVDE